MSGRNRNQQGPYRAGKPSDVPRAPYRIIPNVGGPQAIQGMARPTPQNQLLPRPLPNYPATQLQPEAICNRIGLIPDKEYTREELELTREIVRNETHKIRNIKQAVAFKISALERMNTLTLPSSNRNHQLLPSRGGDPPPPNSNTNKPRTTGKSEQPTQGKPQVREKQSRRPAPLQIATSDPIVNSNPSHPVIGSPSRRIAPSPQITQRLKLSAPKTPKRNGAKQAVTRLYASPLIHHLKGMNGRVVRSPHTPATPGGRKPGTPTNQFRQDLANVQVPSPLRTHAAVTTKGTGEGKGKDQNPSFHPAAMTYLAKVDKSQKNLPQRVTTGGGVVPGEENDRKRKRVVDVGEYVGDAKKNEFYADGEMVKKRRKVTTQSVPANPTNPTKPALPGIILARPPPPQAKQMVVPSPRTVPRPMASRTPAGRTPTGRTPTGRTPSAARTPSHHGGPKNLLLRFNTGLTKNRFQANTPVSTGSMSAPTPKNQNQMRVKLKKKKKKKKKKRKKKDDADEDASGFGDLADDDSDDSDDDDELVAEPVSLVGISPSNIQRTGIRKAKLQRRKYTDLVPDEVLEISGSEGGSGRRRKKKRGRYKEDDDDDFYETETEKVTTTTHHQFWKYIDSMYEPITEEKLSDLNQEILPDDDPLMVVPELGEHYMKKWELLDDEDDVELQGIMNVYHTRSKKRKTSQYDEKMMAGGSYMKAYPVPSFHHNSRRVDVTMASEVFEAPSMTQRLLACLVEEMKSPKQLPVGTKKPGGKPDIGKMLDPSNFYTQNLPQNHSKQRKSKRKKKAKDVFEFHPPSKKMTKNELMRKQQQSLRDGGRPPPGSNYKVLMANRAKAHRMGRLLGEHENLASVYTAQTISEADGGIEDQMRDLEVPGVDMNALFDNSLDLQDDEICKKMKALQRGLMKQIEILNVKKRTIRAAIEVKIPAERVFKDEEDRYYALRKEHQKVYGSRRRRSKVHSLGKNKNKNKNKVKKK